MDLNKIIVILNVYIVIIITYIWLQKIHNGTHSKGPIDYIIKDEIDDCYLSVHNFISIEPIVQYNKSQKSIFWKFNKSSENIHTYISTYTKPYLLQLIKNSSKDCICNE